MTRDEELRARLREKTDELVERILRERKASGTNSLEDIEGLAIEAGRRFREEVLQQLVEEESSQKEVVWCAECGGRMRSRGKRRREIVSQAGEVKVKRSSYECPACGHRIFPPG